MKKLTDLRDHLLAAVPGLSTNPDRLLLFAEEGSWTSANAVNLSHVYSYTASLVLTDFAGSPNSVMLPLLQWVARHQNELLANPANRDKMTFEAEVLANDLVDLSIKLPLTERIIVKPDANGDYDLAFAPEPAAAFELADTLKGGTVRDSDGNVVATLPAIAP